jgi:AcrR family transcriptional regulator
VKSGEPQRAYRRFPGLRAPKPLLSPDAERRLTARQLELLEELQQLVAKEELAGLTIAQIAAEVGCSLRTLYGIAPSKEELVLTVVDRRLHRIGRRAIEALDESLSPLAALRAYLRVVNEAVLPEAASFSEHFGLVPGAKRLLDGHENYVMAVTQRLLEQAAAEGEIRAIDAAPVAHVLGGLGRECARSEVAELSAAPPKETADAIAEIFLRGLGKG